MNDKAFYRRLLILPLVCCVISQPCFGQQFTKTKYTVSDITDLAAGNAAALGIATNASGGFLTNASIGNGLYGSNASHVITDIDTVAELETALGGGGLDFIISTDIDTVSELFTIIGGEGTGVPAALDLPTNGLGGFLTTDGMATVSGKTLSGSNNTFSNIPNSALDAELAALGGVTSAADKLFYFNGVGTATVADFTSFARTFNAVANAGAGREALGLGGIQTQFSNSVSGLASLTNLSSYARVCTLGYYAAGDGGGNEYIYRSTGRSGVSGGMDNGFYIAGPGADDYFEAADKSAIWAHWWGILPSASTTAPDTVEWATKLAAALVEGGQTKWVMFKEGSYNFQTAAGTATTNPTLRFNLNTNVYPRLRGHGKVTFQGATDKTFIRPDEDLICEFDNITFDSWGSAITYGSHGASGYLLQRYTRCKFTNCVLPINDTNVGADMNFTQFIVNDCDFDTVTGGSAIILRADEWTNVDISNNRFKSISGAAAVTCGIFWGETGTVVGSTCRICDNIFDTIASSASGSPEVHGILVYAPNVNVSNNIVRNLTAPNAGANTGCEGIYVRATAGVVADNVLTDAGRNQGHLQIKGDATGADGLYLTVTGNEVYVTTAGESTQYGINVVADKSIIAKNFVRGAYNGMAVQGTGNMIAGNSIEEYTVYGIQATGATDTDITGNRLIGGSGALDWGIVIYVSPSVTVDSVNVTGNTFRDLGESCFRLYLDTSGGNTLSNVTLKGNVLRDSATGLTVTNAGGGTLSGINYSNDHFNVTTEESGGRAIADSWAINGGTSVRSDANGHTVTAIQAYNYNHNNTGASAGQTFTLPPVQPGMRVTFTLTVAQDVDVNPDNGDVILGLANAAGDAISSDAAIGSSVVLIGLDTTNWAPESTRGTWTDVN